MFDGAFKGNRDPDWKEKEFQEQQEILRRRRANGGFLSEEQEAEIRQRRANVGKEEVDPRDIQAAGKKVAPTKTAAPSAPAKEANDIFGAFGKIFGKK